MHRANAAARVLSDAAAKSGSRTRRTYHMHNTVTRTRTPISPHSSHSLAQIIQHVHGRVKRCVLT